MGSPLFVGSTHALNEMVHSLTLFHPRLETATLPDRRVTSPRRDREGREDEYGFRSPVRQSPFVRLFTQTSGGKQCNEKEATAAAAKRLLTEA